MLIGRDDPQHEALHRLDAHGLSAAHGPTRYRLPGFAAYLHLPAAVQIGGSDGAMTHQFLDASYYGTLARPPRQPNPAHERRSAGMGDAEDQLPRQTETRDVRVE